MKNYPMTVEEQRLWQKVYAAAFVADFYRTFELYCHERTEPFDDAVKSTSAEMAVTIEWED